MEWRSVAAKAIRTCSQELYNRCIIRTKSIDCSGCRRKTARWHVHHPGCSLVKKSQTTDPDSDQTFLDPNAQLRGKAGIQGPESDAPSMTSQRRSSQTRSVGKQHDTTPSTNNLPSEKERRGDLTDGLADGRGSSASSACSDPRQQTERDRAEVRSEGAAHPRERWC